MMFLASCFTRWSRFALLAFTPFDVISGARLATELLEYVSMYLRVSAIEDLRAMTCSSLMRLAYSQHTCLGQVSLYTTQETRRRRARASSSQP